jgi:carbon-monoxide dehydrogenase medium subunit
MTQATEVLLPGSADEAVEQFGDGDGVTVIGGGTIVLPDITAGRTTPTRTLMLGKAGLAGVTRAGGRVTIGATTPVSELVSLAAPVGPCAANVADVEIRGQGTLGGNLCAGEGPDAPRGDLQGALLAVDATVRSAGAGGITEEPLEEFLPKRRSRLILDVSYDEPVAGAFSALDRPHTHDYTALAVSAARTADGSTLVAATGAGWHAVRLRSAEAAAAAGDPAAAGEAALADVSLHDDAVASAWYRGKTLPVLVSRCLAELKESA